MFPIRDNVPGRTTPWVTWMLILVNVMVFRYQTSLDSEALRLFLYEYGFVPAQLSQHLVEGITSDSVLVFRSMGTSLFLHGGWLHLITNMWSLWLFGDNVEDSVGRFRFIVFYLAAGLAASLVHFLFSPLSSLPTIGASGAIAAVMGAYVVMFPLAKIVTLIPIFFIPLFVELPALVFIGIWFFPQVVSGVGDLMIPSMGGGIAWWAHIGGFLFGVFLIPVIRKKKWEYRCFYEDGHYHCGYE